MTKRGVLIVAAIFAALTLAGCSSKGSVKSAEKIIRRHFGWAWQGSELIDLELDIEKTKSAGGEWAEKYGDDEGIIFVSTIKTSKNIEGSLSPNQYYSGWEWILTRKKNGGWKLRDWGFT